MNKFVKYLTIIILLSSALAVSAQNDEKAIRKGNRQYKKANYAEAIAKYKEVVELSPNNTKARFNLGDAYYGLQQYDSAYAAFEKVVEMSPDAKLKSDAVFNMGNCLLEQGKYYDAFNIYKTALKIDADNADALYNLEFCRAHLVKSRIMVNPAIPHGSVEANEKMAFNGQTITLTGKADDGYGLSKYVVVKADDNQVTVNVSGNHFEMPKFDVEEYTRRYPGAVPVQAPVKGQLLWQVDVDDDSAAPLAGTAVKAGEGMGFVQTYYGMEEIIPAIDGRVVAVLGKQGEKVAKGEIIAFVQA